MSSPCVQCGRDTSFGSGRFVNRIPANDGYLCPDCQADNCDACVLEMQGADEATINSTIEDLIDDEETGALCDHHSYVPA